MILKTNQAPCSLPSPPRKASHRNSYNCPPAFPPSSPEEMQACFLPGQENLALQFILFPLIFLPLVSLQRQPGLPQGKGETEKQSFPSAVLPFQSPSPLLCVPHVSLMPLSAPHFTRLNHVHLSCHPVSSVPFCAYFPC